MTLESTALSALAAASLRATEGCRPPEARLFDDPITLCCLPPLWRGMTKMLCLPGIGPVLFALRERVTPGVVGNLLCRTRYIDDALCTVLEAGIDQVVILGAGFDTRPYRLGGVERVRVFEVDHPAAQGLKRKRLERALGGPPPHVTFVPVDFDRQRLDEALAVVGFRPDLRTFFIWEGVTQYITGRAVDATLRTISRLAGVGSRIAFTYVWRGIIDGSARSKVEERIVAFAERMGSPWIFGLEPVGVPAYLVERGFALIEDAGAEVYRERYLEPLGRRVRTWEGERMVLARVVGVPAPDSAEHPQDTEVSSAIRVRS